MGVFHCPMGAVGIGDENCINCGMCTARTKAEQKAASELVREHLRKTADKRLSRYLIKKIAICGKGGVGKSTVVALSAIALRDMGYEVLVIDTDDSNKGLHRKLGFDTMPKPLLSLLDRFNDGVTADTGWLEGGKLNFEDIPEEYLVSDGRMHLLVAGKIEDALQGCACSLMDIVKVFLSKIQTGPKQIVIIDNEAGVESFGRGIERYADTILMIVEPSFESIEMAKTIKYMAEGMGIARVRAIINKVPSDKAGQITIKRLLDEGVKYLGVMKLDDDICEAGLMGTQLGECDAKAAFERIIMLMLDESEMEYNEI